MLSFIAIIGWIPLILWSVRSGTTEPNRFGEDPKEDGNGTEGAVDPSPSHPHLENPEADPN